MTKVVYVRAHFRMRPEDVEVEIPTGKFKRNILGIKRPVTRIASRTETVKSDCEIDGERLTKDIAEVLNRLETEGYEVVSLLPIISGTHWAECDIRWARDGGRVTAWVMALVTPMG